MTLLIKDGGVWKESEPYVRDGGVWKPVDQGFVKDAGVWKEMYTAFQLPTVIGEPYGGGFYVGEISYGGKNYKIIKAPKSAETSLRWKTTQTDSPGTESSDDGMANTNAMNDANHPAAKYCKDYRGGGTTIGIWEPGTR